MIYFSASFEGDLIVISSVFGTRNRTTTMSGGLLICAMIILFIRIDTVPECDTDGRTNMTYLLRSDAAQRVRVTR